MRVLLADDSRAGLQEIQTFLENHDCTVLAEDSVECALRLIQDESVIFDVALLDKVFHEETRGGLILLRAIRRLRPQVKCIVLTAFPNSADAWEAMDHGAYTCERRSDLDAILSLVQQAYTSKEGTSYTSGEEGDMWALGMPRGRQSLAYFRAPLPRYKSNEVVARTLYLGVCGTDIGAFGADAAVDREYPLIEFHEVVGQVVAKGSDVTDDLVEVGDWVVPVVRRCQKWSREPDVEWDFHVVDCDHWHDCANRTRPDMCLWRPGYLSRGTGKYHGFGSEFFSDGADYLVKVSDHQRKDLNSLVVLAEPMSVAWKAIREVQEHRGLERFRDRVLIVGAGPIGMLCLCILQSLYPGLTIHVADLGTSDRKEAVIRAHFPPEVLFWRVTRGQPWPKSLTESRYEVVIDATGDISDVFPRLCEIVTPEGIMALLSVTDALSKKNVVSVHAEAFDKIVTCGITIVGSVCASHSDMESVLRFMHEMCNRDFLQALIWPSVPQTPSGLVAALKDLTTSEDYIKIVVECTR